MQGREISGLLATSGRPPPPWVPLEKVGKTSTEAPTDPPTWVLYPKGVDKGVVVGNVKGGKHKWVLFGTRETPYKVAAHLCYATEATATAQWQMATGGGGEKQHSMPPPPHRRTRRPAKPQPPDQQRPPRSPPPRSAPVEPATGSAEDRAWDTQALWEYPSSREL